VIRKNDIATGLASANYLRQRIENIEGQYVIILLDEIGNMSKDTLQEVINSIKRIESQNRLIVSIFTQPSSSHGEIVINKY
jgi:Cdc6-like AAA superfamily ATPase